MSDSLNNTPDVQETMPADAPTCKTHKRGCPISSRGVVREWWWMRITSALLVPLSVWFITSLVTHLLGATPADLAAWLANPFVAAAMGALVLMTFIHTRLGVHEMITDYAHTKGARCALNLLVDFLLLVLGGATLAAIWHLHTMA